MRFSIRIIRIFRIRMANPKPNTVAHMVNNQSTLWLTLWGIEACAIEDKPKLSYCAVQREQNFYIDLSSFAWSCCFCVVQMRNLGGVTPQNVVINLVLPVPNQSL